MSYLAYSLSGILDAFAANDPVPGGGSAAALTGALGVSLVIMVAGLPRTRRGTPEEAVDMSEASARLRPLRETLSGLVDRDTDAYREVMAAYRLPKATSEEQAARRTAIDDALRGATDTPLDTMRMCQQALEGAVLVATNAVTSALSDAAVGIELLSTALRCAGVNVDTNLPLIKDEQYVAATRTERQALEADGLAAAERARAALKR